MNDKYKKLTLQLEETLRKVSDDFILKILSSSSPEGEDTSDLINLVLSSHLSSMCTMMQILSEDHPEMEKIVKEFIKQLLSHIANLHPIKNMEVLRND